MRQKSSGYLYTLIRLLNRSITAYVVENGTLSEGKAFSGEKEHRGFSDTGRTTGGQDGLMKTDSVPAHPHSISHRQNAYIWQFEAGIMFMA